MVSVLKKAYVAIPFLTILFFVGVSSIVFFIDPSDGFGVPLTVYVPEICWDLGIDMAACSGGQVYWLEAAVNLLIYFLGAIAVYLAPHNPFSIN